MKLIIAAGAGGAFAAISAVFFVANIAHRTPMVLEIKAAHGCKFVVKTNYSVDLDCPPGTTFDPDIGLAFCFDYAVDGSVADAWSAAVTADHPLQHLESDHPR